MPEQRWTSNWIVSTFKSCGFSRATPGQDTRSTLHIPGRPSSSPSGGENKSSADVYFFAITPFLILSCTMVGETPGKTLAYAMPKN
ncbi:hypothetical protein CALVIDRAFT_145280 [Calocera viscosa TUFC12733]|uniref:Uncharacterized protein n=1 Tax=Calocera viscosa (strain TUFC12733) TaxID=1330018 RepID=A0A167LST7_CALVF|nr:hypothetical protein CALVIDRAFT_145280 [Calocera viscosa TUFC12733]